MRRNTRSNQNTNESTASTVPFSHALLSDSASTQDFLKMNFIPSHESAMYNSNAHRFENTIEVKVEIGDTLQAVALRFHCTVADIKRLNKIDKDNEIHARRVVKIPVTVHNVLLDSLPIVHKSGNNSPKSEQKRGSGDNCDSINALNSITRNPLEDAEAMLSEKLIVAAVNSSRSDGPFTRKPVLSTEGSNNSKFKTGAAHISAGEDLLVDNDDDIEKPLITDALDGPTSVLHLHRIKGPSFRTMDWSGSDCDMSWICLFVVILAICFVIPLIYVFYVAEHSHHNTTELITSHH